MGTSVAKTILIFGNGYDLQMGLPTRYKDFVDFYESVAQRFGTDGFNPLVQVCNEDKIAYSKRNDMKTARTYTELIDIHGKINSWIMNCDSKAIIGLNVIGAYMGVLLATDYIEKIIEIVNYMLEIGTCWSKAYLIISVAPIMLILYGCLLFIRVIFARVNITEFAARGVEQDSVLFFSSIAKNDSLAQYQGKLMSCSTEQLCDDLVSQIYVCSIICDKKFALYKSGLLVSIIGVVMFTLMLIAGIVAKYHM